MAWMRGSQPGEVVGSVLRTSSLYVGALLVLAVLLLVSQQGVVMVGAALVLAVLLACLAALGSEGTAIMLLTAAFFTAPFYKGVAPTPDSLVTGTDALLGLGFLLLLPRLVQGRVRPPAPFLFGTLLMISFGLVGSIASAQPTSSLLALTLWISVMAGLPIAFALWRPGAATIDLFAIAFVAGQIVSLGLGRVQGKIVQGRDAGLSTHPNYFAEGGIIALALLLYLYHRHGSRSQAVKVMLVGAAGICGLSVLLSGSRAGVLVVAGLLVLVPIVERSAIRGFFLAATGALVVVLLPALVGIAGPSSGLARLTGTQSAAYSTEERLGGLHQGLDRFHAAPLTGSGVINLYELHNNYLEVLVATGVFGLVGYLLVGWSLAAPLFGPAERRRLVYVVWAYLAFGATVPSLYDRTAWPVIALSAVAIWLPSGRDPAGGDGVEREDGPHVPARNAADRQRVQRPVRPAMGK